MDGHQSTLLPAMATSRWSSSWWKRVLIPQRQRPTTTAGHQSTLLLTVIVCVCIAIQDIGKYHASPDIMKLIVLPRLVTFVRG